MAKPTDPQELVIVNAQDQYKTSSIKLNQLITSPPPNDADFSIIDLWVIDAQFHWEMCSLSWHTAKVPSIEWCKLEYNLLELFVEIPDDLVAYSCVEYNELVKQAHQFNMDVIPIPMSQMPAKSLVPGKPTPSSVVPPTMPTQTHTTTPVPQAPSVPIPVVAPLLAATTTPLSVVPPREPLPVKPCPIFKKKTTATPDRLSMVSTVFALDVTSPLHPNLAALIKTGPPKAVNAASCHQVLPGPNPIPEGSVASTSCRCMPLFFLGTDDEEEIAAPRSEAKGKEKEIVPGTDKDKEDVVQDHDTPSNIMDVDEEDNSPPPTNITSHISIDFITQFLQFPWVCYLSPFLSALFKLLGAPPSEKLKKGLHKKSKFDNPLPTPDDSATEGTIKAVWSLKKASKAAKAKEIVEVPKGEVMATKANHPRGPSHVCPPPATLGLQIGGFGEEVPANYKAVKNGLKSIGVLVVSRDFRDFVEVNKALWNKRIAPFIGEQVWPFSSLSFYLLFILFNTINAFESSMDTLSQHTSALEDLVTNYMAGLEAMSQLHSLHSQIGYLHKCLGSDSRVEEVIEEEDDEGSDIDNVAEGEPGPSRKHKRSGK
ncbi:hypothetical protein EDD18DRAFT_1353746 [Armillaria luteobubalina]|uniref:Uncharacterized protein n=1 Tax=Armillaria luteobubalina TaxID=153913 RepID=A0AA39Q4P0_9AGAR|nr:hypothetical protein EDD18DRAFT_1353746 [Armillaria luteobubalina]